MSQKASEKILDGMLKDMHKMGKGLESRRRFEKRVMEINHSLPPDRPEKWRPGMKSRWS